MTRLLAVAHQTAETEEFLEAVRSAAQDDHADVVVLVPATPVKHLTSWTKGEFRAIARDRAEAARRLLEESGVKVVRRESAPPTPSTRSSTH